MTSSLIVSFYQYIVHVFIKTKPGTEEAFKEASMKNARNSANEPGVARFDVLQDKDNPSEFVLVEVYKDSDVAQEYVLKVSEGVIIYIYIYKHQ